MPSDVYIITARIIAMMARPRKPRLVLGYDFECTAYPLSFETRILCIRFDAARRCISAHMKCNPLHAQCGRGF